MSAVRKPATDRKHPAAVRGRITSNLGTGVLPGEDGPHCCETRAGAWYDTDDALDASQLSDLATRRADR
jgi:hypothetical protein